MRVSGEEGKPMAARIGAPVPAVEAWHPSRIYRLRIHLANSGVVEKKSPAKYAGRACEKGVFTKVR